MLSHFAQDPFLDNRLSFTVTPEGVLASIPVVEWNGKSYADLYWAADDGSRMLLCIESDPDSHARSGPSHGPSYRVGHVRNGHSGPRLEWIDPPSARGQYTLHGHSAFASWQTILIKHRPSLLRAPGQLPNSYMSTFLPLMPMQLAVQAPFRVDEGRMQQLLQEFLPDKVEVRNAQLRMLEDPTSAGAQPIHPAGDSPTSYVIQSIIRRNRRTYLWVLIIKVGQCRRAESGMGTQSRPGPALWAEVVSFQGKLHPTEEIEQQIIKVADSPEHDCRRDHVLGWPALRKQFELNFWTGRSVVWSFKPCPINPEGTLVLDASFHDK